MICDVIWTYGQVTWRVRIYGQLFGYTDSYSDIWTMQSVKLWFEYSDPAVLGKLMREIWRCSRVWRGKVYRWKSTLLKSMMGEIRSSGQFTVEEQLRGVCGDDRDARCYSRCGDWRNWNGAIIVRRLRAARYLCYLFIHKSYWCHLPNAMCTLSVV